jgi:hypothetical protein
MKKLFQLILVVFLFAVLPSLAQWSTDPTVNTAISTATGNQEQVQICATSDGGYIMVWQDSRNGIYDIYTQKVNSSGAVQWTVNGVAICTATNHQFNPTIVSDGSGGAIITWYDYRSGNNDIYAQKVNSSGTVQWTSDGVAICTATGSQANPQIVSDGSGGAIITWLDYRSGTNYDIYSQKVNSSGTVQWSSNGVAICTATNEQSYPTIVSDGSGGAIITWRDYRNGNFDIYAQKINTNGAVQWTADGLAICTATIIQTESNIVSDGSGGAIITWQDSRNGNNDIYAQKVNSSGTVQWTSDGVEICTATGSQAIPQIVSDGSGGAIITWYDYRSGTNYDIYSQKVNSSGTVQWTADGVAICIIASLQDNSKIVSDGNGGAIITWRDYRNGNDDVFAQRVNQNGAVQWTADGVAISTATNNQHFPPVIVSDGSGGAIITWKDYRSGTNYDIYAQNVSSDGLLGATTPTVTTTSITNILNTSATSGGNVTSDVGASVTARGVCWSTSPNPTIANSKTTNGTGTGAFTSNITGLSLGTTYYVRAYATNSMGTSYGSSSSFTTTRMPSVVTVSIDNIDFTTATVSANVTNDNGYAVTERGVCWGTSANPTTAGSHVSNGSGTGTYSCQLTDLNRSTVYHVRAYAINSQGTAYGNNVTFSTVPTLPEWGLIALISLSAMVGGWFVWKRFV